MELPRDAKVVEAVLRSSGVDNFDAECVPQLLEFTQRYIADVLEESAAYMEHRTRGGDGAGDSGAGGSEQPTTKPMTKAQQQQRNQITEDDLRLAVKSRTAFGYMQMPAREVRAFADACAHAQSVSTKAFHEKNDDDDECLERERKRERERRRCCVLTCARRQRMWCLYTCVHMYVSIDVTGAGAGSKCRAPRVYDGCDTP